MKSAQICLAYTQQGDDFQKFLDKCQDPAKALMAFAEHLRNVAARLNMMSLWVEGDKVEMYGEEDFISISGPDGTIEGMVQKRWAVPIEDETQ